MLRFIRYTPLVTRNTPLVTRNTSLVTRNTSLQTDCLQCGSVGYYNLIEADNEVQLCCYGFDKTSSEWNCYHERTDHPTGKNDHWHG